MQALDSAIVNRADPHPRARSICLLAIAACLTIALTGCGEAKELSNTSIADALDFDNAYVTVTRLQNTDATNYSNTILKSTSNPDIKSFATSSIALRAREAKKLDKISDVENIDDPMTVHEASRQLDRSPERMAVNADGTPSVAPSSDAGYRTAMLANVKGALASTNVEVLGGGPGGVPFARQVYTDRSNELEQLKALK